MPESVPEPSSLPFELTPRQRRHRTITVIVVTTIISMLLFGSFHPFFRVTPHAPLTALVKKALAAKMIVLMSYWTVCFLLATSLFLIAWLEVREIRRKTLIARRDIFRAAAEKAREEQKERDS